MKKPGKRLPDAELEVMQALWACEPPAQRQEIEIILNKTHPMAPTTLLTQLSRLAEKGFLSIAKEGRRSIYTPLVRQEDYLAAQSSRFFYKLCKGSVSTFAAALCDSGLSREELEELRELLNQEKL